MSLNPKATVRHMQLATGLRRLRMERGLTNDEASERLGWASSRLSKAENAHRKPSRNEVEAMLDLYGCEESDRLTLLHLVTNIAKRGWWVKYSDVVDAAFLELEHEARELRCYQRGTIPGLLQTDEHTLALIKAMSGASEPAELQGRRLTARQKRKLRLQDPDAPVFHAVIEESLLVARVGGDVVWREQLEVLLEMGARENVTIQVMPTSVWRHPGHAGSFTIMGFGLTGELDVVYVEGALRSKSYLEDADSLEQGRLNFDTISKVALSEAQSAALIRDLLAT